LWNVVLRVLVCQFHRPVFLSTVHTILGRCKPYHNGEYIGPIIYGSPVYQADVSRVLFLAILLYIYTSQQKKRHKDFFKYIFMLKPKQLFIIIYVNVWVKRVYLHKTNNNILLLGRLLDQVFCGQCPQTLSYGSGDE
jgi:hypothetical protein